MLSRCIKGLSCICIGSAPQAVRAWKGFSKSTKASAGGPAAPAPPGLGAAARAPRSAPARWDRNVRDGLDHK